MKRLFFIFLALIAIVAFASLNNNSTEAVTVIVLDAGHGGKDPGAMGTGRYDKTEKDIALDVTLKLGAYIEKEFDDVRVVYTRKDDSFPTLKDRTELANNENADLFLSIHCDSFTKSSASGTSSHVMGLRYTEENLRIAQKENSVIYLEDNYSENYDGFEPNSPESIIALTLSQTTFLDQSIMMAQKIQDQFKNRVNRKDRGVKQTPLWVTSRTSMPSVLVELGFISNPQEEDFLQSDEGQTYMASAIFRAFKDYKNELEDIQQFSATNPIDVKDKNQKNIEEDKIETSETIYKVQIATSQKNNTMNSVSGYKVSSFKEGEFYKYTIGNEKNIANAKDIQKIAKESGYQDAFIISFVNGKKVNLFQKN